MKKIKDQGKLFERLSSDYDIGNFHMIVFVFFNSEYFLALQKNADAPRSKRR